MKREELDEQIQKRLLRERALNIVGGAMVVAVFVTLALVVWQKGCYGVDTSDFDGRIVDRWAGYNESTTRGSQPYFRLAVEGDDGKRFNVKVDPAIYESAKVGMRIKRRAGQIVLIETESKSPGK